MACCVTYIRAKALSSTSSCPGLGGRVIRLYDRSILAEHPGKTYLHHRICKVYYLPQIVVKIMCKEHKSSQCEKKRVRLMKRAHPLALLPAERPLPSVGLENLGSLYKKKRGLRFMLVIADSVSNLAEIVPLRRITAYHVAGAFTEH